MKKFIVLIFLFSMPFLSHADWTLIEDGEIWYSAGSKVCSSSITGPERSMSKTRIKLTPTPINPKADGSGTHSWDSVGVSGVFETNAPRARAMLCYILVTTIGDHNGTSFEIEQDQ